MQKKTLSKPLQLETREKNDPETKRDGWLHEVAMEDDIRVQAVETN
jgi:hypothetical protein